MTDKERAEWAESQQGKHICQCGCGEAIIILPEHAYVFRGIPKYKKNHVGQTSTGIGKYHDREELYTGIDKPTRETVLHKKHGTPNILGNFPHCRFYREEIENNTLTVDCRKQGKRESCKGCYICPHCTGKMFLDVVIVEDHPHSYAQYNKVCIACTLHVFGDMEVIKKREVKKKAKQEAIPSCDVEGCKHKAWEGFKHVNFHICHSHRRKHRTWLRLFNNGERDETERPLIIENGKLRENPKYNRKVKNVE